MAHPQHIGHIVDKLSDPHNHETTAYLVYANLGKGGAEDVCNALIKNNRIRKINLSKNLLEAPAITQLLPAFSSLSKLESLDLGSNQIGSAGLKALLPTLAEHLALRTLDLSNNLIGEQAGNFVADFLQQSQSLYHLNLHDNQINHAAMAVIAKGLQENHALRSLNLSHNPLNDTGVILLATAVQSHPNLEKLFLGHTQMGDVGLKALVHACAQQKTINTLDLSLNHLTDKSMPVLAEYIEKTQSLYSLDLQQNKLTNQGVQLLLNALEHNRSICSVQLSGNHIDANLIKEINSRLAYNRHIEHLYQELQQLQKRANLEAMAVHKEYLYNKSAPLAYRLTQEHYRDAAKQLRIIHHRLGKLSAAHDPIAAWTYLIPLGESFNDINTLLIRAMVTFAKQAGGNQAFYEKALLLLRANGEPHNIEPELLEVVMGILVARNLVTEQELQEFSSDLHQLIGAEKVVTINDLVQVAHHVRDSIKETEKTAVFTKICLQPGYVSADDVDAFLRIPVVRKECVHRFNTANLVTYEHLLICPEATALNHALRSVTVKKIMEGIAHGEKDLTHFTMHQTRIEQTFQESIGQYEITLQKALTVFYEAALQNAQAPQEKYQIILEIYDSKLPLGEKIIDMLNYLLVYCYKEGNDPWASSQLERVLTSTVGENVDTEMMINRVMQLTQAVIGTKQLTRWQTRRLALFNHVEKPVTWQTYLPWHAWRKFRLASVLRRADNRMDAKDRFRLVSRYLSLI